MKRSRLFAFIFSILFAFLNSLTYLIGRLNTPPNTFYLGTVHWSGDYFYYLSLFAQGTSSWFSSYNLFDPFYKTKVYLGWVNVFLGRIFSLFRIDHFLAYQLSVAIFTFLFLYVSYLLIEYILCEKKADIKKNKKDAVLVFLLFLFSNAFPKSLSSMISLNVAYYDFWYNQGVPFSRLVSVPHQLLERTLFSLFILLFLKNWKDKRKLRINFGVFIYIILGFVIASIDPVHWLFIAFVSVLVVLLYPFFRFLRSVYTREDKRVKSNKTLINEYNDHLRWKALVPSVLLLLGGLPVVIYLKRLFNLFPFAQLIEWEVSQQINVNIIDYILANGPVALMGLLGLVFLLMRKAKIDFFAVFFISLSLIIFFLPTDRWFSIVNVRFLTAILTLFYAYSAYQLIRLISSKLALAKGKKKKIFVSTAVILILILSMPLFETQLKAKIKSTKQDATYYLPNEALDIYKVSKNMSSEEDVFLVVWPFNWYISAVSTRRVYRGHELLTAYYYEKDDLAKKFFSIELDTREMTEFLQENNIDYIIAYAWDKDRFDLDIVDEVYQNSQFILYRVDLNK